MKSLIGNNKSICYVCGRRATDKHHIFEGTANRQKSEEDGLYVYLCRSCHDACHKNTKDKIGKILKMLAEEKWLETNHKTKKDFVKRYGINYLEIESEYD